MQVQVRRKAWSRYFGINAAHKLSWPMCSMFMQAHMMGVFRAIGGHGALGG